MDKQLESNLHPQEVYLLQDKDIERVLLEVD